MTYDENNKEQERILSEFDKMTGAKTEKSYLSGLSLVNKIKSDEENIGLVGRIVQGFESLTKERTIAKRITAIGLAAAMTFSMAGCTSKQDKEELIPETSIALNEEGEPIIPEDSLFSKLLNKSESEKQQEVLGAVGNFLADYNIRFADPIKDTVTLEHSETKEQKTITIRPALTWDEVMAMSLVYNNFSKNELIEILNGGEIDAYTLNNAYKMSTLQLMGAHVLETRENPVNLDMILHSEEAKDFYEKYHEIFLKAKESTGEERLNAVKEFYDELYKDFPITEEVRTEGIAHSDARASIQPYKFSIIPMVAASEIMFQNLEVDHTLTQQAIDYLNDIGGCNIAEDILEKAELIALTTTSNDKYADYEQVRAAMITFLTENNAYVIDDDHRDLSDLPAFQEIVNGFLLEPYTYTIVSTYTVTEYYTVRDVTETDDRDKAVELAGEDAVKDAEEKAQAELDKENEKAKEDAEKDADEKANETQKEEDKKKEDLQDRVDESDQDLQDRIDNANEEINNGGTVNEDDLGHGTDFDDEHSNSNGDLDESVKDITTDGSGAVDSSTPLPDPNAESYSTTSYAFSSASQSSSSYRVQESAPAETEAPIYEYEEPYTFTSEEEVDLYVESLAASTYNTTNNESRGHRL